MNRNFSKSIAFLTLLATIATTAITATPSHAKHKHFPDAKLSMAAKNKVKNNIVQTAVSNSNLSTLVAAVKAAGLVDALSSKGPFTVFAPDNLAFAKLAKNPYNAKQVDKVIAKLLADPTGLATILKYHVVEGNFSSNMLKNGMKLKTLNGQTLTVFIYDGGKVVLKTNSGSPVAVVTKTNTKTSNGTVHIINNVLIPKKKAEVVVTNPQPGENNYDSIFVKALKVTGLGDAIKYDTNKKYTLLAPEDYAFAKLSKNPSDKELVKSDLAKLIANKDLLTKVLKNHIIEGSIKASDLKDGMIVYNILGDELKVKIVDHKVQFIDVTSGAISTVIKADEQTKYGITHTITDVILP